jgi:hypothetical protein
MRALVSILGVAVMAMSLLWFGGCRSKVDSTNGSASANYRNEGSAVPRRVLLGDMMYDKNEATDPPRRVLQGDAF